MAVFFSSLTAETKRGRRNWDPLAELMNNEAVSRFNKRLLCRRQFFSLQKDKKLSFPRPVNVIDLRNTTTSSPALVSRLPPPCPASFSIKKTLRAFSVSNCISSGPDDGRRISFLSSLRWKLTRNPWWDAFVFGGVYLADRATLNRPGNVIKFAMHSRTSD